ncbi:hypothetical protein EJ05DRAFT_374172 [Pseudovirgaria hyperparasitica]|uniref:Transmembrane protein n=1 Tax=Pseudovirgaria hyperparasitica TaxID=470096 RepID=A0A6A6W5Y1_9PEZI|nr:uncharacterized protein EJ05DRAFT_374172 [Pseudovirgaria hyperparasitica]KAF2758013.1 hypothetical protein EJ05DRAFT_374172 [Pseudovirgaria hyperparasitica]
MKRMTWRTMCGVERWMWALRYWNSVEYVGIGFFPPLFALCISTGGRKLLQLQARERKMVRERLAHVQRAKFGMCRDQGVCMGEGIGQITKQKK